MGGTEGSKVRITGIKVHPVDMWCDMGEKAASGDSVGGVDSSCESLFP